MIPFRFQNIFSKKSREKINLTSVFSDVKFLIFAENIIFGQILTKNEALKAFIVLFSGMNFEYWRNLKILTQQITRHKNVPAHLLKFGCFAINIINQLKI